MEIDRQCRECRKIFVVNSLNIKQRLCKNDSGNYIQITFCGCKECGAVNVLQLDDERTMQDMKKLTMLVARRIKDRNSHKRDTAKDREQYERLDRQIKERRVRLWKENEGKAFTERGGKILIKSLTPYIKDDII